MAPAAAAEDLLRRNQSCGNKDGGCGQVTWTTNKQTILSQQQKPESGPNRRVSQQARRTSSGSDSATEKSFVNSFSPIVYVV